MIREIELSNFAKHALHWPLWLGFALLYAATTAQGVLPADSGEFQLVAARWGIAHPPGYPLYTLLGGGWVHLFPWGSAAWRLNLLSAGLAATTLTFTFSAVRTWAQGWGYGRRTAAAGGLIAALTLGGAATFWAQATTANIRMLTMLFTAAGFWALAHLYAAAETDRPAWRLRFALLIGLGVGHHPSLIFTAVGWGTYLLLVDFQPRQWFVPAIAAAMAWGVPQLYLPLRGAMSDVPLNPGNLATWTGFWNHVLARGFGGDMFAFASRSDLAQRLPLLPSLWRMQFSVPVLLAMGMSWGWLMARHWRVGLALGVAWGVHTYVTITYRAPQTVEYLMPAYFPMAAAWGLGASGVLARVSPRAARRLALVTVAVLGGHVLVHVPDFALLANDDSPCRRVAPLLTSAPPQARILADWRWATPLWVLQQVEGLRPDVQVAYVYPEKGLDYEAVWHKRVQEAATQPVFTTHRYDWPEWTFAPVGGGYRLYARPLEQVPQSLPFTPLKADLGSVRLLGYQVLGSPHRGGLMEVRLMWQATGKQTPAPSFTVRLWDSAQIWQPAGLLSQADRNLGSDAALGEIRFAVLTLQLPFDVCPATLVPTVGAYFVADGSFHDMGSVDLPPLAVDCSPVSLPTAHPWLGGVLGGPWLTGVDYDVAGDTTTAYFHWCGPGRTLLVQSGGQQRVVPSLLPGQCQTIRLPVDAAQRPTLHFLRADGRSVPYIGLPLPRPRSTARYVPFGNAMVLTSLRSVERGGQWVAELTWRASHPLAEDDAVSVRLVGKDGQWLGMHDMQPGLGALPTLKWVTRGVPLLDPHPFPPPAQSPARLNIAVYERFRLTPLPAPETSFSPEP